MTYKPQQNTPKKKYTAQEYLLLEEQAPYKSEFHDGEIRAMAGGTVIHGQIAFNLNTLIGASLLEGGTCSGFSSDVMVRIEEENRSVYPDGSVVCGEVEDYNKVGIKNPLLIFEVLSDSTAEFDRTTKFKLYQSLESFKEYVLIKQGEPSIQTFFKTELGWVSTFFDGLEAVLDLKSIDVKIPLSKIYYKIDFAVKEI